MLYFVQLRIAGSATTSTARKGAWKEVRVRQQVMCFMFPPLQSAAIHVDGVSPGKREKRTSHTLQAREYEI
ncbi:hypothetical protein AVEN_40261-1 [Araneus ventricosus]|uniref:Uncharacterized protein n=1 Tax=Araneus ventricosus TaxID=182803 RepID=A0A4Y2MJJ0_ARAVE|nr:hypothetical protein AVEN_40261-1 [Araneus ventricosus]